VDAIQREDEMEAAARRQKQMETREMLRQFAIENEERRKEMEVREKQENNAIEEYARMKRESNASTRSRLRRRRHFVRKPLMSTSKSETRFRRLWMLSSARMKWRLQLAGRNKWRPGKCSDSLQSRMRSAAKRWKCARSKRTMRLRSMPG
jgi:hypothetical protein